MSFLKKSIKLFFGFSGKAMRLIFEREQMCAILLFILHYDMKTVYLKVDG